MSAGTLAPEDAAARLGELPYAEVAHAVGSSVIDHHREIRTGVPEIVYGAGKTAEQIAAVLRELVRIAGVAIATRVDPEKAALVRALVPEVWQVQRKEGGGGRHGEERRKYLRIQVLREVTLSSLQAIGLEPWGRMKVDYLGLDMKPMGTWKTEWDGDQHTAKWTREDSFSIMVRVESDHHQIGS